MRGICGVLWLLLIPVTFLDEPAAGFSLAGVEDQIDEMVPMVGQKINVNAIGRKLMSNFKICSLCTCCSRGYCLATPCCYAINCHIPNRPFGYCAFTPNTCNCFRCHI